MRPGHCAILDVKLDLHRLDWVGLGTLFLGVSTLVLAFLTWRVVREARKERGLAEKAVETALLQAEVAQKTLDAQIQPLLIEVPLDLAHQDFVDYPGGPQHVSNVVGGVLASADVDLALCSVPFRNAGKGLAQLQAAWLEEGGGTAGYAARDLTRPNLPPGETVRANFVFRNGEAGFAYISHRVATHDDLIVGVRYTDIAGRQERDTRLRIRFRSEAHTNWEAVYVEVGEADTGALLPPGAMGPPPV